jgi:hypothetical protein
VTTFDVQARNAFLDSDAVLRRRSGRPPRAPAPTLASGAAADIHPEHAYGRIDAPDGSHIFLTATKQNWTREDLRLLQGHVVGHEQLMVDADHVEHLHRIPPGAAWAALSAHGGQALGDNHGGHPTHLMRDGVICVSHRLRDVRLVAVDRPVEIKVTYYDDAAPRLSGQ